MLSPRVRAAPRAFRARFQPNLFVLPGALAQDFPVPLVPPGIPPALVATGLHRHISALGKYATTPAPWGRRWPHVPHLSAARIPAWPAVRRDPAGPPVPARTKLASDPDILPPPFERMLPRLAHFFRPCVAPLPSMRLWLPRHWGHCRATSDGAAPLPRCPDRRASDVDPLPQTARPQLSLTQR